MTNRTVWTSESGDGPEKPIVPTSMPQPNLGIPNLPAWPSVTHRVERSIDDGLLDDRDFGQPLWRRDDE